MSSKTAKPKPASPALFFAVPARKTARLLTGPIENCLRLQADALSAGGAAMSAWLQRRHDGVEAALDCCERLAACRDYDAAAAVQRRWLDGALERFGSDLQAATDHWLVLSRQAATLAEAAVQTTAEAASRPMAWAVRQEEAVDAAPSSPMSDTKTTAEALWERR